VHRPLLVLGLAVLLTSLCLIVVAYPRARASCATNVFSGNATEPGACRSDQGFLGGGAIALLASLAMIGVSPFLRPKSGKRS
jgi:hypothetical protein